MKKFIPYLIVLAMVITSGLTFTSRANAEEMKMVGVITKITLATDGKSAQAILKDTTSEELVTLEITDDLTLDKFKDKRIVEGDEIRCKYEKKDGKNTSQKFLKTAGC